MNIETNHASPFNGLLFVLPTRNRGNIAIHAIRSILESDNTAISLVVSDNSTDAMEQQMLKSYCESRNCGRVRYIRPNQSLSMDAHWDWAISQALCMSDTNHITVLTDRCVYYRHSVDRLVNLAMKYSNSTIVWRIDHIYDHRPPCRIELTPTSGELLRCRTADILSANARYHRNEFIPVLFNCITTRGTLRIARDTFGSYCRSLAPDVAAGFRILAIEDEVLILDTSLAVNWRRDRSNGFGFIRGIDSPDKVDFLKMANSRGLLKATPFPDIATICNTVMNEYLTIKTHFEVNNTPNTQLSDHQESFIGMEKGNKFPAMDYDRYIQALVTEIGWIEDEKIQQDYLQILQRNGITHAGDSTWIPPWAPSAPWRRPTGIGQYLRDLIVNETTRPFWWLLFRYVGIRLPHRLQDNFPSAEQALWYVLKHHGLPSQLDFELMPRDYHVGRDT